MGKTVKSLEELHAVAEEFLREIASVPVRKGVMIIGLSGDLGAGKTAFVKCIADILGIKETITSPTFILEKIYIIPRGSLLGSHFLKLIHIDAYRLHSGDEMRALDWEALIADASNIIFIEWPEQVAEAMPEDMIKISFAYIDEKTRKVNFLNF